MKKKKKAARKRSRPMKGYKSSKAMDEGLAERYAKEAVSYQFGVKESKLTRETTLESLGADSLDVIEIALTLEHAVAEELLSYHHRMESLTIPDKHLANWVTINDMIESAIEVSKTIE